MALAWSQSDSVGCELLFWPLALKTLVRSFWVASGTSPGPNTRCRPPWPSTTPKQRCGGT
eukprot:scaffold58864_cov25-Prasinocladus_malaysianus.AAC.1